MDRPAVNRFLYEKTLSINGVGTGKHKAVWDWLCTSTMFPLLYFIYSESNNGDVVFTPENIISPQSSTSDDIVASYINGVHQRVYSFVLTLYLPNTLLANVDENIQWANIVEEAARWVEEQDDANNFPDFGTGNSIERAEVLNLADGISARDEHGAKYMFGVRFTYTDETRKIVI